MCNFELANILCDINNIKECYFVILISVDNIWIITCTHNALKLNNLILWQFKLKKAYVYKDTYAPELEMDVC